MDSILISTPYLPCGQQIVTSNTGPILVFPRIQPFGSDVSSSLGRMYSRQATESVNCENSSVSHVMKYCPTSTVVRNAASIQNLITRFCCESLFYRSSCANSSIESVDAFITLGTNNGLDCPSTTGLPVLTWQKSHSSHISATAP